MPRHQLIERVEPFRCVVTELRAIMAPAEAQSRPYRRGSIENVHDAPASRLCTQRDQHGAELAQVVVAPLWLHHGAGTLGPRVPYCCEGDKAQAGPHRLRRT
eukprot:5651532-Prymnesium_polylepis.1